MTGEISIRKPFKDSSKNRISREDLAKTSLVTLFHIKVTNPLSTAAGNAWMSSYLVSGRKECKRHVFDGGEPKQYVVKPSSQCLSQV